MKYTKFILGLIVASSLVACHKYEEPETHNYVNENSSEVWTKSTAYKQMTIEEFLNTFLTEFGSEKNGKLVYPPRPGSYTDDNTALQNYGLFSVDTISTYKGDTVVIAGRVVSSDVGGNIYKTIYIQDLNHPEQGLKIGVDAGSVTGYLPKGQVIAIKVTGLCVGKYAKGPQLGVAYYNDSKEGMDKAYKVGWEIGRIPLPIFKSHVQLIGAPDETKCTPITMTIPEISQTVAAPGSERTSSDWLEIAKLANRYVKIDGIHFTQKCYEYGVVKDLYKYNLESDPTLMYDASNKYAIVFAPTTYDATNGKLGYPQNRIFVSGSDTLAIGTSEYAKFAHAILPNSDPEDCFVFDSLAVGNENTYEGSITGFVSFYDDRVGQSRYADNRMIEAGAWTITINSLDDIVLTNKNGKKWRADEVYYPAY